MKFTIHTLGCKVNQCESQSLRVMLTELGYFVAEKGEIADIIIVNTCAVTAESGRKSRQAVRRLQTQNPNCISVVCGCFSQLSPEDTKALGADIVYGSADKTLLVNEIEKFIESREGIISVGNPLSRRDFEDLPVGAESGKSRAFLKIQDGCTNFCTYCIIPYTRGGVRSMPIKTACEKAIELAERGFGELVLTGIEIASYGRDLENKPSLIDLIEAVSKSAPKLRIRIGSLEPRIITEDFAERLSKLNSLCPHFHLSLQSGCDEILTAMNRKYDTALFFEKTEILRRYFPNCGITADLIVGFPGESDTHHEETLAFIQKCQFSSLHIFPYSPRPGTKAAAMGNQLTNTVKSERASQAQKIADKMENEFLCNQIGKTLPVIFETYDGENSKGHSDNYCEVTVSCEIERSIVHYVKILTAKDKMLVGITV